MNKNKSRFSIATNFDNSLLPQLADLEVSEIYGSITNSPGGTGRPQIALPNVTWEGMAEHIKLASKNGITFTLLMNSACFGNIEFTCEGQQNIVRIITLAKQVGIETITISNPLILRLIKKHAPNISVKVSVHAEADSISRIAWWFNNGVDFVTLPTRCNRNFRFLKKLRPNFVHRIEILLNNLCLPHCALDRYHGQIISHDHLTPISLPDPCLIICNLYRLQHLHTFLSSAWIRPEDLWIYENLGFRRFKLTDRCKSTNWLLRVARAYTKRKSPDNLMSILNFPQPLGESERITKVKGWKMPSVKLCSKKLENFILPFLNEICDGDCPYDNGCSHCNSYVNKALVYEDKQIFDAIQKLKSLN